MAPGDGKTVVSLGLVKLHKAKGDKVIIATCNEVNRRQISDELAIYCPELEVKCIHITSLHSYLAKDAVVIFDEFDAMVDRHVVHFDQINNQSMMFGLVAAKQTKRNYLLSATYNKCHLFFMHTILQVPVGGLIKHASLFQMHDLD